LKNIENLPYLESGPNAPPLVAQQYRPTAGSMNDG